jgi:hypothetical protein
MLRLGLLLLTCALGACSGAYVNDESSAAAGGTAANRPLMVRFNSDNGGPERVLPTDYPDFHPGDKAQILANGKVGPM